MATKKNPPEQWLAGGALIAIIGVVLAMAAEKATAGIIIIVIGVLVALVGVIGLGIRAGRDGTPRP